jgi:glycosyltransferase involved in cell wall biosynthesis
MHIGIYNPYINTRGGGEKIMAVLADLWSRQHRVTILVDSWTGAVDLKALGNYLNADLSRVQVAVLPDGNRWFRGWPWPALLRHLEKTRALSRDLSAYHLDLFVNCCYMSNVPPPARQSLYVCMFPQQLQLEPVPGSVLRQLGFLWLEMRMLRLFLPDNARAIQGYTVVAAISRFTQAWVKEYWRRESMLFPPCCEDMAGDDMAAKDKVILHVGRFFPDEGGHHHKHQLTLLEVFRRMVKAHEEGWQLHFAGGVSDDPASCQFAVRVVERSEGLPVFFHFNLPFERLRRLYQRASIYWHATGYGTNLDAQPFKQEHFGITTVEAMTTGTVPVVINRAGQTEIVQHGVTGFLWDSLDELKLRTEELIDQPDLRARIGRAARFACKVYNREAFEARALQLLQAFEDRRAAEGHPTAAPPTMPG